MIGNQAPLTGVLQRAKIRNANFLKILAFLPDGNKALLKILTVFCFPRGGI
jgi:hypothetical protein